MVDRLEHIRAEREEKRRTGNRRKMLIDCHPCPGPPLEIRSYLNPPSVDESGKKKPLKFNGISTPKPWEPTVKLVTDPLGLGNSSDASKAESSPQKSCDNEPKKPLDHTNDRHYDEFGEMREFRNAYEDEEIRGQTKGHTLAYLRNIGPSNLTPIVLMNIIFGCDFLRKDEEFMRLLEEVIIDFHLRCPKVVLVDNADVRGPDVDRTNEEGSKNKDDSNTSFKPTLESAQQAFLDILKEDEQWRNDVYERIANGSEKYLLHPAYVVENFFENQGLQNPFKSSANNGVPGKKMGATVKAELGYIPNLMLGPWCVLGGTSIPHHNPRDPNSARPYLLPIAAISQSQCPLIKYIVDFFTLLKNGKNLTSLGYAFANFRSRALLDRYRQLMVGKKVTANTSHNFTVSFARLSNLEEVKHNFKYHSEQFGHILNRHCFWFNDCLARSIYDSRESFARFKHTGGLNAIIHRESGRGPISEVINSLDKFQTDEECRTEGKRIYRRYQALLQKNRLAWSSQGQAEKNAKRRSRGGYDQLYECDDPRSSPPCHFQSSPDYGFQSSPLSASPHLFASDDMHSKGEYYMGDMYSKGEYMGKGRLDDGLYMGRTRRSGKGGFDAKGDFGYNNKGDRGDCGYNNKGDREFDYGNKGCPDRPPASPRRIYGEGTAPSGIPYGNIDIGPHGYNNKYAYDYRPDPREVHGGYAEAGPGPDPTSVSAYDYRGYLLPNSGNRCLDRDANRFRDRSQDLYHDNRYGDSSNRYYESRDRCNDQSPRYNDRYDDRYNDRYDDRYEQKGYGSRSNDHYDGQGGHYNDKHSGKGGYNDKYSGKGDYNDNSRDYGDGRNAPNPAGRDPATPADNNDYMIALLSESLSVLLDDDKTQIAAGLLDKLKASGVQLKEQQCGKTTESGASSSSSAHVLNTGTAYPSGVAPQNNTAGGTSYPQNITGGTSYPQNTTGGSSYPQNTTGGSSYPQNAGVPTGSPLVKGGYTKGGYNPEKKASDNQYTLESPTNGPPPRGLPPGLSQAYGNQGQGQGNSNPNQPYGISPQHSATHFPSQPPPIHSPPNRPPPSHPPPNQPLPSQPPPNQHYKGGVGYYYAMDETMMRNVKPSQQFKGLVDFPSK